MAEATLWTGSASQWKNSGAYALCLLVVPIPWAFAKWLQVRCRVFRLTNERLIITSGIFSKTTEALELYRVRDFQVQQSLMERLVGLHTVHLITSDASTPQLILDCMPVAANLPDLLREHIEECRVQKRVREVEIE